MAAEAARQSATGYADHQCQGCGETHQPRPGRSLTAARSQPGKHSIVDSRQPRRSRKCTQAAERLIKFGHGGSPEVL